MTVTLKIYFSLPSGKQDVRRWTAPAGVPVFTALISFLESVYGPARFGIQYDDGEDLLTISSEVELQEGLALHSTNSAGQPWKLLARFDSDSVSAIGSPVSVSGLSTPSLRSIENGPPSPSGLRVEEVDRVVEAVVAAVTEVAEAEVESEKADTPLIASPKRSDDEDLVDVGNASVDLTDFGHASEDMVEAAGAASDDEYVRIEEDASPQPPVASPVVTVVAEVSPTVATIPVVSEPVVEKAAPVVSAPSVDPLDSLIEQRSSDRFACRLCPKLFKNRKFVVDHLNNRHANEVKAAVPMTAAPVKTEENTTEAITAAVAATVTTPVVEKTEPKIEEASESPKSSPIEIADVTGHHEHVEASPEPEVVAPVTTPSSSSSSKQAVHNGITCDGCGASPIVGNRYHCTACLTPGGYDLCESCENAGDKHPSSHTLLKLRTPAHIPVGTAQRHLHCPRRHGVPAGQRPKAHFVSDVTLADGLQVHAGETLQKVWSIKNIGTEAWPIGTRLVFAGGDLAPESDNITDPLGAAVPFAGPNEIVNVAIDIQVPNEIGRFRATFRLQTPDGIRFGPRIWIDLVVPEQQPAAATAPAPTVVEPVVKAAPAPVVEAPKATAPVPAAAPAPVVAAAPVVVVPSPAECKQSEEEALASAYAESHSNAVAAETRRFPAFAYPDQLVTLRSMGFKDAELCRYLLLNNHGDVQKVVAWLLNNTSK